MRAIRKETACPEPAPLPQHVAATKLQYNSSEARSVADFGCQYTGWPSQSLVCRRLDSQKATARFPGEMKPWEGQLTTGSMHQHFCRKSGKRSQRGIARDSQSHVSSWHRLGLHRCSSDSMSQGCMLLSGETLLQCGKTNMPLEPQIGVRVALNRLGCP